MAKFYIYRNLRTKGFSVKIRGKVIDRCDDIVGHEVQFKVSESGRLRVLRDKRRNVHAYAVCRTYAWASYTDKSKACASFIASYNPYNSNKFLVNNQPIEFAKTVLFSKGKCYIIDL